MFDEGGQPSVTDGPLSVAVNSSALAGPVTPVDGWITVWHAPPGPYRAWPALLPNCGGPEWLGDVTPLTSSLELSQSPGPRLHGKVVAAPGFRLHPGLRVAVCCKDLWLSESTVYGPIEPDGTYDVATNLAGELEVSLVAGRATRLAMHRVTVSDRPVTEVPDLVYAGLPSD